MDFLQLELGPLIPLIYGAGHTVAQILAYFSSFEWLHGLRPHVREVLKIFETKTSPGDSIARHPKASAYTLW